MGESSSSSSSAASSCLTEELITSSTGEENLELLEEIEIIFSTVHEIGQGLRRCSSLRSLSLINTGLKRVGGGGGLGFQPVANTLVRLCLCDQLLTSFEGIELPQLRELFLHQNRITSLKGLHGCPRVQRLWIFSNSLQSLEGLHACGGLRELWAQDNLLTRSDHIATLPSLQSLQLAGNPISDTAEIQKLSCLTNLHDLCLADVHFGRCPVVDTEGYRAVTVACLNSLQRLDGMEVTQGDRRDSRSQHLAAEVAFQDRVRSIREQELAAAAIVESKRRASIGHAAALRAEVSSGLVRLEEVVKAGWGAVAEQAQKREAVAKQAVSELERALSGLVAQYNAEIDAAITVEKEKMEKEEVLFAALEQRARAAAEHMHALENIKLQDGVKPEGQGADLSSYVCIELGAHSPEFQHMSQQLKQAQLAQKIVHPHQSRSKQNRGQQLKLLAAHRVRVPHLMELGVSSSSADPPLYLHARGRRLARIFTKGLHGLGSSSQVALFTDPALALSMSPYGLDLNEEGTSSGEVEMPGAQRMELGLACNIIKFRVQRVYNAVEMRKLSKPPQSMDDIYSSLGPNAPPCVRVLYDTAESARGECLLLSESDFAFVVPDACLLCGCGLLAKDPADIERSLAELAGDGTASGARGCSDEALAVLQIRMREELKKCRVLLEAGIGPDEAARLQAIEGDLKAKELKARQLRSDIEEERAMQEEVLRSFRS
jgi:hypothetical protein